VFWLEPPLHNCSFICYFGEILQVNVNVVTA